MPRRLLLLALVSIPFLATPGIGGAFDPGDVVVLDLTANKAILISDPGTPDASGGNQIEVILNNSGIVTFPRGGVFDPNGDLYVSGNSEIHHIKDTGAGSVSDGFPQDWQFIAGGFSVQRDIVRDPDTGELFVAHPGFIFVGISPVDPITGIVGDNVAQGGPMFFPTGLIWEGADPSLPLPDHTLGKRSVLVVDAVFDSTNSDGLAVIRAFIDDDVTGNQEILYQGEPFGVPRRGAIGPNCSGDPVIFVTDSKGYNVSGVDSVVWELRWDAIGEEWFILGFEQDVSPGIPLSAGGNLDRPVGIAQLPSGDLLVADAASQALIRIDVCGGGQTIISAGNLFDKPWAVLVGGPFPGFDKADLLYANTDADETVSPSGVRELQLDSATDLAFSEGVPFERPAIIAPDLAGNWIVSDDDPASPKVVLVTGDGLTRTAIASGTPLVCPKGLVVDDAGDVIVADPCAGQLFRIPFDAGESDSYGTIVPFPTNPLPEREFLRRPTTVGILEDGFLLVGEAGEDPPPDPLNPDPGRLVLISPDFNTQACLAEEAQLRDLRAWTEDLDGSFLITTPNDAKLIRFISSLATFLVEASGTDFVSPEGVAIDLNRDILVIDSMAPGTGNAQLLRVDPFSTSPPVLETFSNLFDPFGLVRSDPPSKIPDAPTQEDFDGDGINDLFDNCIGQFNPADDDGEGNIVQLDQNGNGLGDECDEPSADASGDGFVGAPDFIILSGQFGSSTGGSADFTGDSNVGSDDFILLSGQMGQIPPSFGVLSGPLGCPQSQLP